MCGIVGAVTRRTVIPILLEGLHRLEYRGYDSAGVAVLDKRGVIQRVRKKGKIRELVLALADISLEGRVGIAHTRWATHGVPSEWNAHPHICRSAVAVVHNGIIENYQNLKESLILKGYTFHSETDTEVIVHQIHAFLETGLSLLEAVRETTCLLEGAYAIAVIAVGNPHRLVAARHGSPLVLGLGYGEHFVASDLFALADETQRFIFLEDGDIADITTGSVAIYDQQARIVERAVHTATLGRESVDRGKYRHYMHKEIYEQPVAIANTLNACFQDKHVVDEVFGPSSVIMLDSIQAVQIIACGTSYHAGLIARYWIESLAGIPCNVEVASEFRYRRTVVFPNTLFVTISQSGETADTLAALREAKKRGYRHTLAICNVAESTIVRESEYAFITKAGLEIGVASTKAFTTQLTALLLLVLALGRRHILASEYESRIIEELHTLPRQLTRILTLEKDIQRWAERFGDKHHALYLGRGAHYPVAMEGALKLKEVSYIHAEAYPSGELKHGPLALIDNEMPVVAVAPNNELLEKLKSNLQEVRARGGELYVFSDERVFLEEKGINLLRIPETHDIIAPIVYTLPLQLLAYHIALIKGTDVDQPRNLAKSVTVE